MNNVFLIAVIVLASMFITLKTGIYAKKIKVNVRNWLDVEIINKQKTLDDDDHTRV